jgi:mono/diheme cytochrome c family protein
MKKLTAIALLIILTWGCAKKISSSNSATALNTSPMPAPRDSSAAQPPVENSDTYGTRPAAVERSAEETAQIAGKSTYNAKCGKCHGLKVTSDFNAAQWAGILAVMAPLAELTATEKENVYAYVKANAKK